MKATRHMTGAIPVASAMFLVLCPAASAQSTGGITLSRVMTIGNEHDVLVSPSMNVVRGARYLYVAANSLPPDEIYALDSHGTLRRQAGRSGQGPGEFRWIRALGVSPHDAVHAFDVLNSRQTVFTADLRLVRSTALAGEVLPGGVLFLEDGSYVLNAVIPDRDRVGLPLHLYSADGQHRRSFGSDNPRLAFGQSSLAFWRLFARARDGGFWTADPAHYVLEHWAPSGDLRRRIHLDPAWFRTEIPAPRSHGELLPPKPSLLSVREDSSGLLWVLGRSPISDWQSQVRASRATDQYALSELVIDVVDPISSEILASTRVASFAGAFVPGTHLLYTYRESDIGVPMFDFWTMTLSRPREDP